MYLSGGLYKWHHDIVENVCEQFIAEVGSIFEHSFAAMCPELAETSVSVPSEQHGAAPSHKDLFLAQLLLAHQERDRAPGNHGTAASRSASFLL